MNKFIDVEGVAKTFTDAHELAISKAEEQLGAERDKFMHEILSQGKVGFLGLGGISVTIRAYYETSEADAAGDFLKGLLKLMGTDTEVDIKQTEDRIEISLSGPDMGMLIGRHGETLDALQYITGLAVNRGGEGFTRVYINTEGYREKREEALRKFAKRTAERALKYGRNITLEPMPASERRIIHTALTDMKGVSTFSTGQEPRRRVVIAVAGAKNRPESGAKKAQGKGGRRGYRPGANRGNSQAGQAVQNPQAAE